ncbi:MAG: multidrug transporter [Mediterranea massiliensis]|nr:multidrug transporter [Mediterranea massiliensis]
MSNNKRIAKNTIFLYIRMFLIMGVTLYTSRIVLRVLGEDDFGLYNVVGGIVAMFTFLNGALAGATSRFITFEIGRKDNIQLHKVFNVSLATHFIIAIVIVLLAETIGLWFLYNKMVIPMNRFDAAFWVYQISIVSCVLSIIQVPYNATIIAHERMGIYAYVGIVEVILKLLIAYLIQISTYDKLVSYAFLLFIVHVLILSYYRIYCNRHFSECKLFFVKETKMYKQMFIFASSNVIGNLSVLAQGQGLNILLNMFFGPVVNAARGIAYQVQGAVTQFSGNFMTAVKPQIIKQYALGKVNEMMELVIQCSCFSYYLMLLIVVPICLEADYILTLWLGEFPNYTVSFLRLVLVLCMIQTLKTPRTTVFHATGKILIPNIVVGTILCMALPIAYVVLRMGGEPNSVFWVAIVCMALSEVASIIILHYKVVCSVKKYIFKVHFRCMLVTIVSLIIPLFFCNDIPLQGFNKLLMTCVISVISILITSYTIGLDKKMRIKIRSLIQQKIFRNV